MILDTNAVSAVLAGDSAVAELLNHATYHHLPVVVIGEYRYGLRRSKYRAHLEGLFDFLVQESIVLSIDEQTANHYAKLRDVLRRRGNPIPENDVWIAALARQHAQSVISRDEHFDRMDEIERISW